MLRRFRRAWWGTWLCVGAGAACGGLTAGALLSRETPIYAALARIRTTSPVELLAELHSPTVQQRAAASLQAPDAAAEPALSGALTCRTDEAYVELTYHTPDLPASTLELQALIDAALASVRREESDALPSAHVRELLRRQEELRAVQGELEPRTAALREQLAAEREPVDAESLPELARQAAAARAEVEALVADRARIMAGLEEGRTFELLAAHVTDPPARRLVQTLADQTATLVQCAALEAEIAELQKTYGRRHPRLTAVVERLTRLTDELQETGIPLGDDVERGLWLVETLDDLAIERRAVADELTAAWQRRRERVARQADLTQQLATVEASLEAGADELAALDSELAASAVAPSEAAIEVVDIPWVSARPVSPILWRWLALGVPAGGVLGWIGSQLGLAWVRRGRPGAVRVVTRVAGAADLAERRRLRLERLSQARV